MVADLIEEIQSIANVEGCGSFNFKEGTNSLIYINILKI